MEEDHGVCDIYQSTYAIVFFGTPHRGSSYANLGVLARDIAVAAGFDARDVLVRSLKPDAEMLTVLRKEFARMLYDKAFNIHSFQEGKGFTGFSAASRKVHRLIRVLHACCKLM
jgi:predicted Ser/Thr protein kinase